MNRKIRVSAVSYTNTLPFLRGINSSDVREQIELTSDVPAACARKLIEDEADLGIVPVQAILDIPNAEIIGDYCIGSDGAVDSVFIFSQKPVHDIQTLRLDPQSRTSNGLARILLKNFWKREVTLVSEGEADAIVLIGDRTFGKKKEYAYSYDLGHYWKEFTGLPFAYAVWVSNKPLPKQFIEKFNEALGKGIANPETVIPGLPRIEGFDYLYYLTKNLDFHLTAEKRQAIARYHELFLQLNEVAFAK